MTQYIIKDTLNVRTIEKANNVELVGKFLNNAQFHLGGYITGYVDIPTGFPMVTSKWFPTDGLFHEDLQVANERSLEDVLSKASERSLL